MIVYTVHEDDLFDDQFGLELLQTSEHHHARGCILDLTNVTVMQSRDIAYLNEIVKMFGMIGKKAVICGFSPLLLGGLIHFIDEYQFAVYKSVEEALHGV